MVDAALFAIREIMEDHPEALLYGRDVGEGWVVYFVKRATLAEQFGDHRVFNTAIQEAYIIGSTVGMECGGIKTDRGSTVCWLYLPGLNQLVTEISKAVTWVAASFPYKHLIRGSNRSLWWWWALSQRKCWKHFTYHRNQDRISSILRIWKVYWKQPSSTQILL